MVAGYYRSRI